MRRASFLLRFPCCVVAALMLSACGKADLDLGDAVGATESDASVDHFAPDAADAADASANDGSSPDAASDADAQPCVESTRRCNDLTPQSCGPDHLWHDETPCVIICLGAGQCAQCAATDRKCNGRTPQQCGPDGQWVSSSECEHACFDGECVLCVEGQQRCDGLVPMTCSGGSWSAQSACSDMCVSSSCASPPCSNDRCTPPTIALAQSKPSAIVVDDSAVFWVNEGTVVNGGSVTAANKDGSNLRAIKSGVDGLDDILVADSTSLYLSTWTSRGRLHRASKDASSFDTVWEGDGMIAGIAIDQTAIYWSANIALYIDEPNTSPVPLYYEIHAYPGRIVSDGSHVFGYWRDLDGVQAPGALASVDVATGDLVGLAPAPSGTAGSIAQDIAIDDSFVYLFWETDPTTIVRVPKNSSSPTVLATSAPIKRLAIDNEYVYWIASDTQATTLSRVAKTGGDVQTLVSTTGVFGGIAVDADAVYWTDQTRGSVSRLAK